MIITHMMKSVAAWPGGEQLLPEHFQHECQRTVLTVQKQH